MAEKKNTSMEEVGKLLEQGVKELFTTEQYTVYLNTMSKFHQYSFNNTVLIAQQNKEATLVAGYKSWEKNFNRHVKQGEKGIRIIAPVPVKHKVEQAKRDERGNYVLNDNGTPQTEEVIKTIPRFRTVTVFDVSQTEGEPLPERPGVQTLTAEVAGFDSFMRAVQKISPVPIRYDDIEGTANGYFDPTNKEIVIKKGLQSESQIVKTAIHEVVHARLHDPDTRLERGQGRVDQTTREIEAESTAYLVCHQFDIDSSDYTFPYVAAWSSSVEMKELRESMSLICDTATKIIDDLTAQLDLERGQDLQKDQAVQTEVKPPVYGDITVSLGFSEHPLLQFGKEGRDMSFAAADHLLRTLDEREAEGGGHGKTDFEVSAVVNGETYTCSGQYDIGNEHTGLADHIRNFNDEVERSGTLENDERQGIAMIREKVLPAIERALPLTQEDREQVRKILDGEQQKPEVGNIVYTPAYDNGKWKVEEIDLDKVRWVGTLMEHNGLVYDRDRDMYVSEDAAWKSVYQDPAANRDLVKFDDDHRPYLPNGGKEERRMEDNPLPSQCYSVLPSTGELIIVKRGESGYYRTTADPGNREANRELADHLNEQRGITRDQEDALVIGSMFGLDEPARDDRSTERTEDLPDREVPEPLPEKKEKNLNKGDVSL